MSALTVDLAKIRALGPCAPGYRFALGKLDGDPVTAAEAREAGCKFDDMAWYLSSRAPHEAEIDRRLRLWRTDCAARVLPVFERACPDDDRAALAIVAARDFAEGRVGPEYLAARIMLAKAAADTLWAADNVRPAQAADAARVCGEQRAAWVVVGCVINCLRETAGAEKDWMYDRLIAWFTGDGPGVLPLSKEAA